MTPFIIIDASTALKWYLEEEYSYFARKILDTFINRKIKIISPPLMTLEVMNGLLSAMLSKRIIPSKAQEAIESFFSLSIPEKYTAEEKYNLRIFDIAKKYKLTIYDSCYLALAEAERCDFYTADKKLYSKLKKYLPFVKFIAEFK